MRNEDEMHFSLRHAYYRDSKHAFASVPISKRNSMNIKHETKKSIGFRSENNDANNKNNNNEAN